MDNKYNALNNQYNSISSENYRLRNNLNEIKIEQENEKRKKLEQEQRFNRFKNTFNNDINIIGNRNIDESRKYIINFILNEFIKDFKENNNKNNLNNFLIQKFINICKWLCTRMQSFHWLI